MEEIFHNRNSWKIVDFKHFNDHKPESRELDKFHVYFYF